MLRWCILISQVLFGLSAAVNLDLMAEDLLKLLSTEVTGALPSTVTSSKYKLRATVGSNTTFSA